MKFHSDGYKFVFECSEKDARDICETMYRTYLKRIEEKAHPKRHYTDVYHNMYWTPESIVGLSEIEDCLQQAFAYEKALQEIRNMQAVGAEGTI